MAESAPNQPRAKSAKSATVRIPWRPLRPWREEWIGGSRCPAHDRDHGVRSPRNTRNTRIRNPLYEEGCPPGGVCRDLLKRMRSPLNTRTEAWRRWRSNPACSMAANPAADLTRRRIRRWCRRETQPEDLRQARHTAQAGQEGKRQAADAEGWFRSGTLRCHNGPNRPFPPGRFWAWLIPDTSLIPARWWPSPMPPTVTTVGRLGC